MLDTGLHKLRARVGVLPLAEPGGEALGTPRRPGSPTPQNLYYWTVGSTGGGDRWPGISEP